MSSPDPTVAQAELLRALRSLVAEHGGPVLLGEVVPKLSNRRWFVTLRACRRMGWVEPEDAHGAQAWFVTASGLAEVS
jgi:hypothetical protein